MDTIRLKNGTEEAAPLVATMLITLRLLATGQPIHLYELVEKARNRSHVFWGDIGKQLAKMKLVEVDGSMNDSIRNIVLSAVEGDGLEMRVVSPKA